MTLLPEVIYDLFPDRETIGSAIFPEWSERAYFVVDGELRDVESKSEAIERAIAILLNERDTLSIEVSNRTWRVDGRARAMYRLGRNNKPDKIYCFKPLNKPHFEALCDSPAAIAIFEGVTLHDFAARYRVERINSWDDLDYLQFVCHPDTENWPRVYLRAHERDNLAPGWMTLMVSGFQPRSNYWNQAIVDVYRLVASLGGKISWLAPAVENATILLDNADLDGAIVPQQTEFYHHNMLLKTGDTIYFFDLDASRLPVGDKLTKIRAATIGKIGRKYLSFSHLDGIVSLSLLKDYRYNLASEEIEFFWGAGEWRLLSRDLFATPVAAATALERKLLVYCLAHRRSDRAFESIDIDLIRSLEPYLLLTPLELESIAALRQIRNPARICKDGSPQLSLGRFVELLAAVPNQKLPLRFAGYFDCWSSLEPRSWRGNYRELALSFDKAKDGILVRRLLLELQGSTALRRACAFGKEFHGYKGGDYLMDASTPLWVANYGYSRGFIPDTNGAGNQAITGIVVGADVVEITSELCEYRS